MENKILIDFFKPIVDDEEELEIIKLALESLSEEEILEKLLKIKD